MSISYQPWALIPDTADPQAVEGSIARLQKRRRPDTPARRESDRRWAEKRAAQRRAARTGETLASDQIVDPMRDALHHTVQERLAAYRKGLALHPLTGEYVHEASLSDRKRGALIAWRKGYRVTTDGRLWNPKGIELFSTSLISIVPGTKHHWHHSDAERRTTQKRLAFAPILLAALCFFGLRALHDGLYIWSRDRNTANRRRENLVLLTWSEVRQRGATRRAPYRPTTIALLRRDGRKRTGRTLSPAQAQAIRQLLDLGWTYQRVVTELAARGVTVHSHTIRRIDKGVLWA